MINPLDSLDEFLTHLPALPRAELLALQVRIAAIQSALAVELGARNGAEQTVPAEPEDMITAQEAARLIHESPRFFYRRRLPFIHRISRRKILISRKALLHWITTRKGI